MKSLSLAAISAITLALLIGCEKKPDPAPTPAANEPPTPAVAPAADKPIAAATTLDLSKVPVEEQYEKEVESEVTATNFEAQLEALEKEIKVE